MQRSSILLLCLVSTGSATQLLRGGDQAPGVGDVKTFAHLLPFRPERQPETMFKTRCVNFLNQVLEKAAYDPSLASKVLPDCRWGEAECKALEDDLAKRLAEAAGGAAAPAPAAAAAPAPAALLNTGSHVKTPYEGNTLEVFVLNKPAGPKPPVLGDHEPIYGWCDTMYEMAKSKAISEIESPAPAPVAAPAPAPAA
eukprot:TRINITY_DN7819_c0_g1_i1.p2 TRINITY_DN7819_c0_g1~~TRINITY_DN7819_c0_g1_i1.p2  ORF type:complete len:197 (-),score=60.33 TRINITY_DN7819_c0_g1_i1:71-661(-)